MDQSERPDSLKRAPHASTLSASALMGQSGATVVSYCDMIENRRKVEYWPTYQQARDRYYALVNSAFAGMVRLGDSEVVARGD